MVEDELDIQAVAQLALEALGDFQVRMCSSGAEALKAAPGFGADLILLDVMMPGMDGPSTLLALRAMPQTATTPIIIMTAKVQPQEVAQYRALGVLDVVAKPFEPLTLAAKIKAIWQRHQPISFQDSLQALSDTFVARLPARLVEVDTAWASLQQAWAPEALATLHRLTHSLHGTSSTLGIDSISRAAHDLELCLAAFDPSAPAAADQRARVERLIAMLKQAATADQQPLAAQQAQPSLSSHQVSQITSEAANRLIFLAEVDPAIGPDLGAQLGHFGYSVRSFATLAEIHAAAGRALPAAIITSAEVLAPNSAGREQLATIRAAHDGALPFIVVSDRADLEARLRAARAGAEAYFTRPVNMVALIDKLDTLTSRYAEEPYRILIVDDEPALANYYAATLRQAGMMTVVATDPTSVMQPLTEFRPDMILMDMYMPGCDGLDLAAVIRQQEDYVGTPIVFLSAETNRDMQLEAMRLGVDDFLTKPIKSDHLISAVINRVQRSRTLRAFMVRDSLTGLFNHTTTKGQLEIELARARRHQSALAFAIIDIDHFKSVNDTYGHPTGDRVLKSLSRLLRERLRKTDIIGRYGGEEFAVVLVGTDGATAVAVIEEIREGLARIRQQAGGEEFAVTFSCGIACFSNYSDGPRLTDAADKALYAAKRAGRNRVVLARPGSDLNANTTRR
jgi:diguanylate cyclase (GGDEF)-like protein